MCKLANDDIVGTFIENNILACNRDGKLSLTKLGKSLLMGKSYGFDDFFIYPKYNGIASRKEVSLNTRLSKNIQIKSPLVCANMSSVVNADFAIELWSNNVAAILHRFYLSKDDMNEEIRKIADAGFPAIGSIGLLKEDYDNLHIMINNGLKGVVIDVAHAFSPRTIELATAIKDNFSIDVIIGNVATKEAVKYLAPYCDGIKCGIGTGSVCKTSMQAGAGAGAATTVIECAAVCNNFDIPLIADGSITSPGDVTKALIAGASCCMAGKIFARCPESAAELVEENGKYYKMYYGMASNVLKNKVYGAGKKHVASEGIAVLLPIGLGIEEFASEFLNAIRSGFTYCGAKDLSEIWEKGELRLISKNAFSKGKPHAQSNKGVVKISD